METSSHESEPLPEETPVPRRGFPLWVGILAGVAAVLLGIIVVVQIATPLAGLVAPVDPPFFDPAVLLEHENAEMGVDEWLFATDASGCEVYLWYAARADYCRVTPGSGCGGQLLFEYDRSYNVAYCVGSQPFGEFTANWEIFISTGYNEERPTRFRIARDVDWINEN
jgi:hypothetical protein